MLERLSRLKAKLQKNKEKKNQTDAMGWKVLLWQGRVGGAGWRTC